MMRFVARGKMAKFMTLLTLALGSVALAGCSACDFPFYVPQSCRSGPPATPDTPPPGR